MGLLNIGFPPPPVPKKPLTVSKPFLSELDQLLPCKWRDNEFPVSSVQMSFEQDLVEHRYWGVDGASVEATGRGAMRITMEIPFVNGIAPGKGESWKSGELYPVAFRAFLVDMGDRTLDSLFHPELGEIRCRPHSYETKHDPQRRDGVIVTATWIESTEDAESDASLTNNLPTTEATDAAVDLDASSDDIRGLADKYQPPQFAESFETLTGKITGIVDTATTTANLAKNKPAQLLSHVKQIENSVAKAKTALTWPITDACERMKSAVHSMPQDLTKGHKTVLRYTTKARSTLAGIGQATGASADDLIKLNPQLADSPAVPSGTVVRYYAK